MVIFSPIWLPFTIVVSILAAIFPNKEPVKAIPVTPVKPTKTVRTINPLYASLGNPDIPEEQALIKKYLYTQVEMIPEEEIAEYLDI